MPQDSVEAAIPQPAPARPDDFGHLVHEHQGLVFSIAYHCLGDRAVAEEVAQDVFLELYRNLAAMESASHVVNWLRRVATHRSIDEARRRKLRPQTPLDKVREPASPSDIRDPLRSDLLRQLVATLPEKARMVVILRFQEEMELAEIAAAMDIPLGTVKSQLQRALTLLREKLARRGEKTI